jgi:3-oxoadipate enol-lactonase
MAASDFRGGFLMDMEINGTRLRYEVVRQGPAVTLVHSIGLSTRHGWREQVPLLRQRYQVVSYDIRGLGESEAGSAPLTTDTFVEDLWLLLQALGIERTALLGVSLGGVIAALAAARHPELVGALVLVSTVCRQSPEGRQRLLRRNEHILASGMGVAVEEQVATHFSPAFAAAHPELMDWYRATYVANTVEVYTRIMQHLSERDICAELEAIRCSTLIVSGEDDEPSVTGRAPLEAGRTLHERIPGSELHGMPGSRHYPQLDQPEVFNRVVGAFLARAWG